MLTYGNDVFSVTVDLPNGLYRFGNMSATGKTWMKEMLALYKRAGANVAYLDAQVREVTGNPELVVVDRFDAFPVTEAVLQRLAKHAVVLVDTKRLYLFGRPAPSVRMRAEMGGIHVCGL